jgi:4-hydroxybenzoyl-CoA thioesterase
MAEPKTFHRPHRVRFAECDPAGIAFYPRYFEMIHNVAEDFYEKIGFDYHYLHMELGKGLPTVHIEADFHVPSRLGDLLDFTLIVTKIGRSSTSVEIKALCKDEVRLVVKIKIVFIDLKTMKSEELLAPLRAKLTEYLHENLSKH